MDSANGFDVEVPRYKKKVKPHHQIFFSQAATKQSTLYVSMILKNIKLLIKYKCSEVVTTFITEVVVI